MLTLVGQIPNIEQIYLPTFDPLSQLDSLCHDLLQLGPSEVVQQPGGVHHGQPVRDRADGGCDRGVKFRLGNFAHLG